MRSVFRLSIAVTVMALVCSAANSQELDSRLVNYDISGQIRFHDRNEAEKRRDTLVRSIWKAGLPTIRPTVTEVANSTDQISPINSSLISKAEQYSINVSNMDFESIVYVLHPKTTAAGKARLAIVHAGHMQEGIPGNFDLGLKDSIECFLENGFIVAAMQMPLVSWNKDATGKLHNGKSFEIKKRGTAGHDQMFALLEPDLGGLTMAFFLEPIVQVTNEFFAKYPDHADLIMIGLSGGGWTTHFSAALDPRITYSIPVAGALPLYARPFSRGSKGDAEQEYAPILGEIDTNNDGVLDQAQGSCSWLEIFALGALSPSEKSPRKQVQVINFDDSCCFNGPVYQTYSEPLSKRVASIGTGDWSVFVDRTHKSHVISEVTISDVLAPIIKQAVK